MFCFKRIKKLFVASCVVPGMLNNFLCVSLLSLVVFLYDTAFLVVQFTICDTYSDTKKARYANFGKSKIQTVNE